MIRYEISLADLYRRIDRIRPTWRMRAAAATAQFRSVGAYCEPPLPFWNEIKRVYLTIQKQKCAFCERKMAGPASGRVEYDRVEPDIEHFRSKRGVLAWPTQNDAGMPTYTFTTGRDFAEGYYLLAYHPLNYTVSCQSCNRPLKRSYFPIAASRISSKDNPADLTAELPLLIYPLSNIDADPEELIGFVGPAPVPRDPDPASYSYQRARVTIDLFMLGEREELLRERAQTITTLWLAVGQENSSDVNRRRLAREMIHNMRKPSSAHCNCARCFVALCRQDPEQAHKIAKQAIRFLGKIG